MSTAPPRLELTEVTQSTCDKTGRLAAVTVRERTTGDKMLVMPFTVASKMFWALCHAGTLATKAKEEAGTAAERERLTDYPVVASMCGAAMAEDGKVDLVLRFGQLQLSVNLDASDARSLGNQLQRAAAAGPTNPQ